MPVSKQWSTQLSKTQVINQEDFKKQRVDQDYFENDYDTSDNKANLG